LLLVVAAALAMIAFAVLALLLTAFPTPGAEGMAPAAWQVETVYWALLGATALMIGGFAKVLSALAATIGEDFRTLPRPWVEEILAEGAPEQAPERSAVGPRAGGGLGG
jgi:hypothetical protein